MVMASMILTDTSDNITAAPRIHDLPALMLVTTQDRARLDEQPHGELLLEERCFFGREVLFGHSYPSFVAASAHVDELYAMTPRAFTADHGPILLVLSEVTQ
jgi:hypothetical protein